MALPIRTALAVLSAAAIAGCASVRPIGVMPELDPFYAQRRDAAGIPVVGSAKVPPLAIERAAALIRQMLDHRPDLARWLRSSRYFGETILVHKFSHDVLAAIRATDPRLSGEVDAAYAATLKAGRWKDEYASTSVDEYWVEGTQFWFDSNKLAAFNGRRILDHGDLAAYDPALYAALGKAYGHTHHLAGDPFWATPARMPLGPIPENTAEVC
jgi:hypothetical protein